MIILTSSPGQHSSAVVKGLACCWERYLVSFYRQSRPAGRSGSQPLAATPSGHDLPNGLAVVDVEPLAPGDLQPSRVQPEQVQDGGVDVGHVVPVLHRVEADLVGPAVDHAALDAAARHPD